MNPRARIFLPLLAAALAAVGSQVSAQSYPTKPIVLVVPFAAGGPTDVVARMISAPMGKSLGTTVVVENTVGAGGTIASQRVAKSNPDGYTVLIHHMGMATAPALYRRLPFDPLASFEYIGQALDVPMTMLARKDFPAENLQQLIAYVKANKDKVTLANAGLGAVSHLCGMMFMSAIATDLTTVPYKGTGPAMTDLLGGQVDLLCDQTTQTVPMIRDGRVKIYGVTSTSRLAALPSVPTLDEQGLKGFEVKVWHGVYAPKGTPRDITEKLTRALREALTDAAVVKRMADLSSDIPPADKISPEGLRTHLQAEIAKWGPVIKKAGVFAD
ncbi:MAG: tripartite tricarboxylate transporter substrate binding protein BugD [Betaproteobacteria bacterium]|jgi:tripartite-type tricarboxylate transporter receptor subunit TctC|nr:tripartite tricarboxylate transporter substrate binding protein BugD [Betaproteobacteria bacterium]